MIWTINWNLQNLNMSLCLKFVVTTEWWAILILLNTITNLHPKCWLIIVFPTWTSVRDRLADWNDSLPTVTCVPTADGKDSKNKYSKKKKFCLSHLEILFNNFFNEPYIIYFFYQHNKETLNKVSETTYFIYFPTIFTCGNIRSPWRAHDGTLH